MKIRIGLCFFVLFFCFPLSHTAAKINFSGLDLSEDSRLLFRADSVSDGAHAQNALFISRLTDLALRQLSVFPEKMELLENGRTLQIRNVFGAVRIPISGGLPQGVPGFPSFAGGSPVLGGRVEDAATSRDGRWLLYVEPVSPAYGNLLLVDVRSGAKILIAANVERPDKYFPACWSPDSRVFVYNRGGKLYYYTVNVSSLSTVDERHRLIGEGVINSVYWGNAGDFFYLRGSTVYRVRGAELFARALYADFLEIGSVVGKIPFEFDANFDAFWISPDSQSILFSKGGRNIFYYPLMLEDFDSESSLPYLMMPRSCFNLRVLWSSGSLVTVIASAPEKDGFKVIAYRLKADDGGKSMTFVPLNAPAGFNAALSPDGTKVLFWGEQGAALYDYINWRLLETVSGRSSYSCVWTGNDEFIIGDDRRIERVRIAGAQDQNAARSLICLSSASEFGFEDKGGRVLAKSGDAWFVTDGQSAWAEISGPQVRTASLVSGRYRVYLEKQSAGPYENVPMIRNTASVGTRALLPGIEYLSAAAEEKEDLPSGGALFSHGLRKGPRETALCFDLYDDASGLSEVLDALNRFGVKATFFLNGEFIRRHPSAAQDIAAGGHETASMFFAAIDLSGARYRIGGDFISRGLARNEDEFYGATGSELSLLWHPPYYAVSPEIMEAASAAGYKTLGRDVDPMDWVSRDEAKRISLPLYSASDMVDRIMELKRPGSIIPIRLGLLPGGRSDYLFGKINVLLDALVRSGYRVIPVSTLIEHAR
jgi:peptidoglycan/xylan/chitin deacetylase (PgdA/CDA1 family)